ncbi:MAG: hypothetical protein KIT25_10125 [Enhydrobacter sp.]|nr:MAG: hypothetical protein KIT25_10125 [Enhydrobacter sp.]
MAGLSFALGASLLALAVPRTMAAWAGLGAQPALHEVKEAREPRPEDIAAGIAALQRAIEWVPSAKRLIDLATLELEEAKRLPIGEPRREEMLRSAEAHFVEGLSLNPVDGTAWLRLAWTRAFLGASARSVVSCLVQSIDMAPNQRNLWLVRARMLLAYWPWMNAEEAPIVRRQFRTIWTIDPAMRRPLVQIAHALKRLSVLEESLKDDPEAQTEFEKLKDALPKP